MTIHLALSGGLDSTALLARTLSVEENQTIKTYSFNYGQRHAKELEAAAKIAAFYRVPHSIIDLPSLASPSLTGSVEIPHGHYAEETMRLTVVQGRNLLFASMLISAASEGDQVLLGVHSGDHAIYPDCRPSFIDPLAEAVAAAYSIDLLAPWLYLTKAEIASLGASCGAPFDLSWSCYEGGAIHCGRCGTCVERAEAFSDAGIADPTQYADPNFWRSAVADFNARS